MMTIRLPEELEARLAALAAKTHRSKSFYMKEALKEYLEEKEDYLLAVAALERFNTGEEKSIPFEAILKEQSTTNV